MKKYFLFTIFLFFVLQFIYAQNIGIGTTNPSSKLHIKGSADASQFIIDANSTQSNANPLIKFRSSDGNDLMWIHSDHASNSFLGFNAGNMNNAPGGGVDNTFIGSLAGPVNTTGTFNTALGYEALFSNTTGSYNTAVGLGALSHNTFSYYNTALGFEALNFNTGGTKNTAVGYEALFANTSGDNNTAYGYGALISNTTANDNTATGYYALYANSTGGQNTATGNSALFYNASGVSNTANGYLSLYSNTASYNTALGQESFYANTTGVQNTAVGYRAGFANTTGGSNVFVGYYANAYENDLYNVIAIGHGTYCSANNQVRMGNVFTQSIGGEVGWSSFSDGRYKKDVQENVQGLDFIMKLRPVTYHLDIKGLSEKLYGGNKDADLIVNSAMKQSVSEKENTIHTGFIAQEVEQTAKEMGYDFSGVDKPQNENDFYGLRYAEFVVPLVKAVQEQQVIIQELKQQVEQSKIMAIVRDQQELIDELRKRIEALEKK